MASIIVLAGRSTANVRARPVNVMFFIVVIPVREVLLVRRTVDDIPCLLLSCD